MSKLIATNAPVSYDWGFTKQRGTGKYNFHSRKSYDVRIVETPDEFYQNQRDRYASGLYCAIVEGTSEWHFVIPSS